MHVRIGALSSIKLNMLHQNYIDHLSTRKKLSVVCIFVTLLVFTTIIYKYHLYSSCHSSDPFQIPCEAEDPRLSKNILLYEKQQETISKNSKCDAECSRFQELLSNWPVSKPKSAIYFLTRSNTRSKLKKILQSLDLYFNDVYKYPVVIFHEEEFRPYIPQVRKLTTSDLYFQEMEFSVPIFLEGTVDRWLASPCNQHIGYRHMCRFHSKLVYEVPIFNGMDYYWRLDDDSLIFQPVKYDVFQFMKMNNYSYGYVTGDLDAVECTRGLWEATDRYITKKHVATEFYSEWHSEMMYYNNFEISSFAMWKSEAYTKYIDYIDHAGGIYYHRWGDAPIKGIAVSMFVPKIQTYQFSNIDYFHQLFRVPQDCLMNRSSCHFYLNPDHYNLSHPFRNI